MKQKTKEIIYGVGLMAVELGIKLYNENKKIGGEEMPIINMNDTMSNDVRKMLFDKFEYHKAQAEKIRAYIEHIDAATEAPAS